MQANAVMNAEEDRRMQTEAAANPQSVKIHADQVIAAVNERDNGGQARRQSVPETEDVLDIVKKLRKDGAKDSDMHVWWALAALVNIARYQYHNRDERLVEDHSIGMVDDHGTADLASNIIDNMLKNGIIKRFDLVIPDFYDRDDRLQGYIDSIDRKGNRERFPMMSLSIAVVTNSHRSIDHPGDVSKIASELKKLAKTHKGSVFIKDQRGTDSATRSEAA